MERRKNRMSVGGLRRAEPTTLAVLTQDVLRYPLTQIEPSTLVDLLALSEVPEQLSSALGKELGRFREQMFRELEDLPDGAPLAQFARELSELDPELSPGCLRTAVGALVDERVHPDAVAALEELVAHWEQEDPAALVLPTVSAVPRVASGSKARFTKVKPAAASRRKKTETTAVKDPRREEWIREDAIARLENYGTRGLKEAVMVAGSRHRAPWTDLTAAEVLATLRKLKREGRVRFSAGRWSIAS